MKILAALVLLAANAAALPDSFDAAPGNNEIQTLSSIAANRGHRSTSNGIHSDGPESNALAKPDTYYNATASCTGEGTGTYGICLDMKGTGLGHNHTNSTPPIEFPNNDRCKSGIPLNSTAVWKFKTPPYSANLALTWRWSGACTGTQTSSAQSGIEGLSLLSSGTGYTLVGATSKHPVNHYATPTVLSAIPLIARDYRAAFPKDPSLLVNDISLQFGGLFDINGDWAPPHVTHRFGSQVDLQRSTIPADHQSKFEEVAKKHGARILIEGTHYHLDFTPAGSPFFEETLRCDH